MQVDQRGVWHLWKLCKGLELVIKDVLVYGLVELEQLVPALYQSIHFDISLIYIYSKKVNCSLYKYIRLTTLFK